MPQFLFISIGAGLFSAVLLAMAATGSAFSIFPLYLSQLPLFMAGLAYGGGAGLIAGATGTIAVALAGGPALALAYFISNAAAPMLICWIANWSREFATADGRTMTEYYPAGLILSWLSALGILILLLLALFMQSLEGGIEGWITRILQLETISQAIIQAQTQTGAAPADINALQQWLTRLALPGLAMLWILICIGNGALAQRLLTGLGKNIRPGPDLLSMSLPGYMLWPLAAGLVLSFFPGDMGFFGLGLASLAAMPYFFLGLATVHVISHRLPGRVFVLAGIYIMLLALGWPFLLIVGLGIVEQFANLRLSYAVKRP